MVAQNTLRECEGKQVFLKKKKIKPAVSALDRSNYMFYSKQAQRFLSYHLLYHEIKIELAYFPI